MDSNHRLPRYKLGASDQLGYSPAGQSMPVRPRSGRLLADGRRPRRRLGGDPAGGVPDQRGAATERTSSTSRERRSAVRPRCAGRPSSHAANWPGATTAQVADRSTPLVVGHDRRVDADHEVAVVRGEPATDTLGVTCRPVQRSLDRDPPAALATDLPGRPDVPAEDGGGTSPRTTMPNGPRTISWIHRPPGKHQVGRGEVVGPEGAGQAGRDRSGVACPDRLDGGDDPERPR